MNEAKLEAMARALCIKRKQDPDTMIGARRSYDDTIPTGRSESQQPRWMHARQEILRQVEVLQVMVEYQVIWTEVPPYNKDKLP